MCGTKLIATVRGLGEANADVDLLDGPGGLSICETALVVAFETVECKTITGTILPTTVVFAYNGVEYTCNNAGECDFFTEPASTATITGLAISADSYSIEVTWNELFTELTAPGYDI